MKIYVLLFTVVWSQMTDCNNIRSSICMDGGNRVVEDPKQCESCSCKEITINDNCSTKYCPCLKILCSQSNELTKDLFIQKLKSENRSNSDMKIKQYWHDNFFNADKRDRNDTAYGKNINPDFVIRNVKKHKRNTEQEREQNNTILERYYGMNQFIRLMSIDYPTPVTQSDSDLSGGLVVLLYFTIVMIGIMICIIVYRKYGHSTNSGDLEIDNQQAATVSKSLLDEDPPPYEDCVI